MIRRFFTRLKAPDISPGHWFREYAQNWADARYIPDFAVNDCLTSGIIEGNGKWIWATATPEWDRDWFEARGFNFPKFWVTWDSIQNASGEAGEYLKLDL